MRKKHYAVERLSERAQEVVEQGLRENQTYDNIVANVRSETGESLAVSSLQRYRAREWFPARKNLEETNRLHGLVSEQLEKSRGKEIGEVSSELLKTLLFNALAAYDDPDPLALYKLVIAEGRLGVQKEKVELGRDLVKVEQDRVEVLQGQLRLKEEQMAEQRKRAADAVKSIEKAARKQGLDAGTLKKIREEVYGIVDAGSQAV